MPFSQNGVPPEMAHSAYKRRVRKKRIRKEKWFFPQAYRKDLHLLRWGHKKKPPPNVPSLSFDVSGLGEVVSPHISWSSVGHWRAAAHIFSFLLSCRSFSSGFFSPHLGTPSWVMTEGKNTVEWPWPIALPTINLIWRALPHYSFSPNFITPTAFSLATRGHSPLPRGEEGKTWGGRKRGEQKVSDAKGMGG